MPDAAANSYKIDRRAIAFTLYEHLRVDQLFEQERYAHLSRQECDAVIDQCARFVIPVHGMILTSRRPAPPAWPRGRSGPFRQCRPSTRRVSA
jgi:hypothetical protein